MNLTFGLGELRAAELRSRVLARGETVCLVVAVQDEAWIMARIGRLIGAGVQFERRVRSWRDGRVWLSVWTAEPVAHLGVVAEVLASLEAAVEVEMAGMFAPRSEWTPRMLVAFRARVLARVLAAHPEGGRWVGSLPLPVGEVVGRVA